MRRIVVLHAPSLGRVVGACSRSSQPPPRGAAARSGRLGVLGPPGQLAELERLGVAVHLNHVHLAQMPACELGRARLHKALVLLRWELLRVEVGHDGYNLE